LQREYDVQVQWIAFPLHPDTPSEGLTLEALFAGTGMDIPAMMARLKQVAQELNLPFGERPKTFNSRLAQELGKWAETQDKGHAFHMAVFKAYFADGLNIAQPQVLLKIARGLDLDEDAAQQVMTSRTFRAEVDRDWQRSHQKGIRAVPTFVMGFQHLTGAQPYAELKRVMQQNAVPLRPSGSPTTGAN
jgi:predicted DsbA family dithiol-disulfide isomerase